MTRPFRISATGFAPVALATLLAAGAVVAGCGGNGGSNGGGDRSKPRETRLVALGGRGPLIGLADNRPETLADPRFRATGIKQVRVAVPFDDLSTGGQRRAVQDAYFKAARAAGVTPLVSFYRSYADQDRLPTPDEFRADFELFRKRYPWVRQFSTWNEANFRAQPTSRNPERAAAFYRILRKECSGGRCTVVTCDFRPDGTPRSWEWLRRFSAAIGPGPHVWGLTPYVDVNRRTTSRTRGFLRRTRGDVWVDEVGAINVFGKGLTRNLGRQTRAMEFLLGPYARVSPRLKRLYVYHWRAAPGDTLFDSALLSVAGRPRPSYRLLFKAIGRTPPAS